MVCTVLCYVIHSLPSVGVLTSVCPPKTCPEIVSMHFTLTQLLCNNNFVFFLFYKCDKFSHIFEIVIESIYQTSTQQFHDYLFSFENCAGHLESWVTLSLSDISLCVWFS